MKLNDSTLSKMDKVCKYNGTNFKYLIDEIKEE